MFFKTYGLLWQNARNLKYIKWFNSKLARELADSKLKTKEFLKTKKIPVPETFSILKSHSEITDDFVNKLSPPFVIKPNKGFWWKWIIVIDKKDSLWNLLSITGKVYSNSEIKNHLLNIIDWFFSLSGSRDTVVIEKKIEIDEEVQTLWTYGLPDIRMIVFNMVPVMAMLRIPTEKSWWKANLHSWACAAWIDIWTGKLTYITQFWKIIKSVPDIGDIRWLILPNWDKMLEMAVKVQKETRIGYLWCDIVMDNKDWPLLLEINIRPGLEVQVANMARLKDRLERVEWIYVNSVEKWVRLWRDLFSWDIEDKIKKISWKEVVWSREYIKIFQGEKEFKYLAEVNSSKNHSIIDRDFVENVLKVFIKEENKSNIQLKINILGIEKNVKFVIKDLWWVNIILWLNSLKWFLLDPFKYKKWELPFSEWEKLKKWINIAIKKNYDTQLRKIDKSIVSIDKKLLILKAITPINLEEEKEKFIKSWGEYIPHFKYSSLNKDLENIEKDLNSIEIPDIPLSGIYRRKKEEIYNKIQFLKSFRDEDVSSQLKSSISLFWEVDKDTLSYCKEVLKNKPDCKKEEDCLDFYWIKKYINKFNHIYWINIVLKKWNRASRFVMKWDVLLYSPWASVWKKEMRSIVAHEIEWHYLRRVNWRKMEYSIFWSWTAGYLEIDEWIAVYNQNRFLNNYDVKYYWIFELYYFVNYALNHSYSKLISKILEFYNYDLDRSFYRLVRLKRWFWDVSSSWVFTKDLVYLNGLMKIEKFIKNWGDLKELYLWKISIEDLDELKESYFIQLRFNENKIPFSL